jgi:hypothetical protein
MNQSRLSLRESSVKGAAFAEQKATLFRYRVIGSQPCESFDCEWKHGNPRRLGLPDFESRHDRIVIAQVSLIFWNLPEVVPVLFRGIFIAANGKIA